MFGYLCLHGDVDDLLTGSTNISVLCVEAAYYFTLSLFLCEFVVIQMFLIVLLDWHNRTLCSIRIIVPCSPMYV